MQRDIQHATVGGGASLPHGALSRMGAAFSADFSAVRVHTGSAADEVASKLNAHALTAGTDIVFRAGAYDPGTQSGDRLLAHELAHVVQQRDGAARAPIDSGPSDPLERAADATADNVLRAARPTRAPAEASVGHVDGAGRAVREPGGSAAAVQRAPTPQRPSPDPQAERAAAVAEVEAVAGRTVEQLEAQVEAEDALRLDRRKRKNKGYAWSLGLKDKARIQKTSMLSPKHQQEITVKVRFFEGEAKAAYIQTIAPALDQFPEQVTEILAEPGSTESGSSSTQQAPGLTCDINQKQWVLQYEGQPEKTRCMAVWTDPEYEHDYFDRNIEMHSAVGYTIEGTTWQNVAYNRFKVMLVNYRNGTSEYFMLDDIGDFHYGSKVHGALDFTYLKRANGLIYPISNGLLDFDQILAPNLLRLKNGLKYQIKDLNDLFTLVQLGTAFAGIIGSYSVVEAFRASLEGFRSPSRSARTTRATGSEPHATSEITTLTNVDPEIPATNVLSEYTEESGFSAAYNPDTNSWYARASGDNTKLISGKPVATVSLNGGHAAAEAGLVTRAGITDISKNVGFVLIRKPGNTLQIRWNSGTINTRNFKSRAAPMQYRAAIIRVVEETTGFKVIE